MMITAVGGGALMFAVQGVAFILRRHGEPVLTKEEYSAFNALLQLVNWMTIPALGLQMVFAQQTAAATTDIQQRQLVGTIKTVMFGTFCIWLTMLGIAIVFNSQVMEALKLTNPIALWLTLAVGFTMLWQPIFQGLMQGRQNFLWLGWTAIFNGLGRLTIGLAIVYFIKPDAAGLMAGVLIGLVATLGTGLWQNFDLLKLRGEKFDATGWLRRVIPLTLGFGASTFLFSADALVVQNYFVKGTTDNYFFFSVLCRAIVLFTAPLAAVMFPKLVKNRASASAPKSNLMGMTLLGTGALTSIAVVCVTIFTPIIMGVFKKSDPTGVAAIIPWFAGGMVPLAMANVLLNNLMAHSRFKIIFALVPLAVGYWMVLQQHHDSFMAVVQTFDVFTVVFLAVCAVFNWVVQPDRD